MTPRPSVIPADPAADIHPSPKAAGSRLPDPGSATANARKASAIFTVCILPPLTVAGLLRFVLAAALLAAAAGKLRAGGSARSSLGSYGVSRPWLRTALWAGTIAAET